MSILISFPIVILLMILQTTFFREITLLNGSADLFLVTIASWALLSKDNSSWFWAILAAALCGFVSAIPWYVFVFTFLSIVIMARFVRGKLWQSPLMSVFGITMIGSIILYVLTFIGLRFQGVVYPLQSTMVRVIIPSIFLNLVFAIPVYAILKDLSVWIFKGEVEQ